MEEIREEDEKETRMCIWLGRHYITLEGTGEGGKNASKGKLGRRFGLLCGRVSCPLMLISAVRVDSHNECLSGTTVTLDGIKMAKLKRSFIQNGLSGRTWERF